MVRICSIRFPILFSQDRMLSVARPYSVADELLRLPVGHRHRSVVGLELGTGRLGSEVAEREPAGLVRGLGGELEVRSQGHARKIALRGVPGVRHPLIRGRVDRWMRFQVPFPYNLRDPVSL